jgi:hypothetical protein
MRVDDIPKIKDGSGTICIKCKWHEEIEIPDTTPNHYQRHWCMHEAVRRGPKFDWVSGLIYHSHGHTRPLCFEINKHGECPLFEAQEKQENP